MDAKKIIRNIFRYTLLDHLLEFVYWALAVVGLIYLSGQSGIESPLMLAIMLGAYILAIVAIYFFIVRKLKAFFNEN